MKTPHYKPPRLAAWLLEHVLPDGGWQTPLGDFEEYFNEVAAHRGLAWARLWYWGQVLNVLPRKLCHSAIWGIIMLANYLKVAFRNLAKRKGYAVINISGLAIGMACCMLILLWVRDELSYDRGHEHAEHLYRVVQDIQFSDHQTTWAITHGPLAPALQEAFPEIINTARFTGSGGLFRYNDQAFQERGAYADNTLFEMFTFPFVKGDPRTALLEPASIIISEEMAAKFFGDEDPLGAVINANNEYDFTITGVFKNIPENSTLQFDYVIPFIYTRELGFTVDTWRNSQFSTFVLLEAGAPVADVNGKIADFLDDKPTIEENATLRLQPITDLHLFSNLEFDYGGLGDVSYVYTFSLIAFFILLIACINFMNLSTAQAGKRAKEVGMRKVAGAKRSDIVLQFYGESVLLSVAALGLALLLVWLFLPGFNELSGKYLTLASSANLDIVLGLIVLTLFTGLVAGSYPALYLSSFQPVSILKGLLTFGSRGSAFRRILVTFQFALSIILIVGTFVVYNQLGYMQDKKLGFKKEQVVYLPKYEDLTTRFETAKSDLLQHARILNVTAMSSLPSRGYTFSNSLWEWEGQEADNEILFRAAFVDYDYFETLEIELVAGRSFSKAFATDTANAVVVINETAARIMGMDAPVGQTISDSRRDRTIVGVVKDYNFTSLRSEIDPLILILYPEYTGALVASIAPDDVPGTLRYIEEVWKNYVKEYPFEYGFLDERIDNLYRAEQRVGTLFMYFTALALFISCLGLLGLAAYIAEQRTKEIGIRKVLGASIAGVILLLSRDFAKWVLLANIIAWPVAYLAANRWLETFAYRTDLGWGAFVVAGSMTLLIALLTISYQAVKAAHANPVEALKYE